MFVFGPCFAMKNLVSIILLRKKHSCVAGCYCSLSLPHEEVGQWSVIVSFSAFWCETQVHFLQGVASFFYLSIKFSDQSSRHKIPFKIGLSASIRG